MNTSRSFCGLLLIILPACRGSLSPLSNKFDVGQQAYVIFAADGEAGVGDLFASAPAGGPSYQITFTRVDEELPALSPDGTLLAFVRSRAPGDADHRSLVVMNLLNGSERRTEIGGVLPAALAWSGDASRIFLRQGDLVRVTPAPPAPLQLAPVAGADRASADSLLSVLLGDPPLAMAVPCKDRSVGICAQLPDDRQETITSSGTDPARWSGDSIVYREHETWVIQPLAGGKTRTLSWTESGHPRSPTIFIGRRPPLD